MTAVARSLTVVQLVFGLLKRLPVPAVNDPVVDVSADTVFR